VKSNAIESALITGDLSKLSAEQRLSYYNQVCTSLGLNSLTRPFDYITLNGKLTLYARKDAADQLRKIHDVSIGKPDITFQDEWIIVTVLATNKDGRTDSDIGVVNKKDMRGDFGNALMKAVTKAKRRVTLSICGLGMLDETEVETIPEAVPYSEPVITTHMTTDKTLVAEAVELGGVVEAPKTTMDLATAEAVVDSKGIRYGDIITRDLAFKANAMEKYLRENIIEPAEREGKQFKLDAVRTILAARNGGK